MKWYVWFSNDFKKDFNQLEFIKQINYSDKNDKSNQKNIQSDLKSEKILIKME